MNYQEQHHMADIGFQRVRPSPQLRPFVQWFWTIQSNSSVWQSRQEFMHPDGGLSLLFNWGDELKLNNGNRYRQTIILEKVSTYSRLMTLTGYMQAFGILFHPGRAYPFFGIPMHEMTSIDSLYEYQLANLFEQLAESPSFAHRVALSENWLIALLSRDYRGSEWVPESINLINNSLGKRAVHEIAERVYLSERQLERLYKREVGLSPKKYGRLIRVRHARATLKRIETANLAEVAHLAGYYDQAHFNRDFKNTIGITPGAYIARQEKRQFEDV